MLIGTGAETGSLAVDRAVSFAVIGFLCGRTGSKLFSLAIRDRLRGDGTDGESFADGMFVQDAELLGNKCAPVGTASRVAHRFCMVAEKKHRNCSSSCDLCVMKTAVSRGVFNDASVYAVWFVPLRGPADCSLAVSRRR